MALRLVIGVVDRPSPPGTQNWVMEVDLACPGWVDSGELAALAARLAQIAVTEVGAPRGMIPSAKPVQGAVGTPSEVASHAGSGRGR